MSKKREKLWNPKASSCSKCPQLKPLKDEKSGTVDPMKKFCDKWKWLIMNGLAEKQAVCMIKKDKKRRR